MISISHICNPHVTCGCDVKMCDFSPSGVDVTLLWLALGVVSVDLQGFPFSGFFSGG